MIIQLKCRRKSNNNDLLFRAACLELTARISATNHSNRPFQALSKTFLFVLYLLTYCKSDIAVHEITSPLRGITCHMGSHPAAVASPLYPSRRWYSIYRPRKDARLSWPGWWLYSKIVYLPKTVIYFRNNRAVSWPEIDPATGPNDYTTEAVDVVLYVIK